MKPAAWTCRELETLRREYPFRKAGDIARDLGRPLRAVYVMASRLGLKKDHYGLVWTPQMLTMLKALYDVTFDADLARCIGVSKRSLIRKARELGLEKEPGFVEKRQKEINHRISESAKRSTKTRTRFKPGHRSPETWFKPGHVETPEVKARRIASYKETVRRRKQREQFRRDYNINNT